MSEEQQQIGGVIDPDPDVSITAMIELLEQLSDVIGEENHHLQSGLPASVSSNVSRKSVLASKLERWVGAVKTNEIVIAKATPVLREKLVAGGISLEGVMSENATRLTAAIDATRHRISAVMYAMREQGQRAGGYGETGHTLAVSGTDGNSGRVI